MQLTPEIKQQLAEQKKQCVFCKLISGEMQAKTVFEDNKTMALLDIYPAIKGHTLFMTKEHYPIMPYLPPDEFQQLFGLVPQLCNAVKKARVATGVNLFIANGGVAGQQAPHFLIHLFPRETGDGFFNFLFKEKQTLEEEKVQILLHNFPLMMQNHFARTPGSWHSGNGERPIFLQSKVAAGQVIYEDEKVLCLLSNKGVVKGHIKIYSKVEAKDIEKLSSEDSAHLFYVASYAATLLFEGLKVQGTNIILKSGVSDDNLDGELCLHVLPRMPEDGLNKTLLWEPKQPSYNLDDILGKLKDKTWSIKYKEIKKDIDTKTKKEPFFVKSEVVRLSNSQQGDEDVDKQYGDSQEESSEEEIKKAIEKVKN